MGKHDNNKLVVASCTLSGMFFFYLLWNDNSGSQKRKCISKCNFTFGIDHSEKQKESAARNWKV